MTWPQGFVTGCSRTALVFALRKYAVGKVVIIRIALSPFVSVFLQLGQTRAGEPSEVFSSVKCTSTKDLRE